MKDHDIIKAIAELDGVPTPHKPTEDEIKSGSYYQFEPAYLTSRDAIIPVIEKQDSVIQGQFTAQLNGIVNNTKDIWVLNNCYNLIVATPPQLYEALLRATGKWKD